MSDTDNVSKQPVIARVVVETTRTERVTLLGIYLHHPSGNGFDNETVLDLTRAVKNFVAEWLA